MRILIIGTGGRERALEWKLSASPLVSDVRCEPSAGVAFCLREQIDFVVVGPEAPLCAGVVDDLEAAGIRTFGPNKAAAQLECSKGFTKDLCSVAGIPTAAYRRFERGNDAAMGEYVREMGAPIVVKADGLAAGKGVVVAQTVDEALTAIEATDGALVIEEFLHGEELSFFALCDGVNAIPFGTARDYKRAFDGDKGPNTGGMGAVSYAGQIPAEMIERIMAEIIRPTLARVPFKGALFAGLMLTATGPKLIEYNVRFGDPETQVLMLRLKSDLLPALLAARDGQLKNFDVRWSDEAAVTVVMAKRGYPGAVTGSQSLEGLNEAAGVKGVQIFRATGSGRVLSISAIGSSVEEARSRAYQAVDLVRWPEGFCRRDIGL